MRLLLVDAAAVVGDVDAALLELLVERTRSSSSSLGGLEEVAQLGEIEAAGLLTSLDQRGHIERHVRVFTSFRPI